MEELAERFWVAAAVLKTEGSRKWACGFESHLFLHFTTGYNMEPSEEEIKNYMKQSGLDYYNAREDLRELAYKGDHPDKSSNESWGDYWKSY